MESDGSGSLPKSFGSATLCPRAKITEIRIIKAFRQKETVKENHGLLIIWFFILGLRALGIGSTFLEGFISFKALDKMALDSEALDYKAINYKALEYEALDNKALDNKALD